MVYVCTLYSSIRIHHDHRLVIRLQMIVVTPRSHFVEQERERGTRAAGGLRVEFGIIGVIRMRVARDPEAEAGLILEVHAIALADVDDRGLETRVRVRGIEREARVRRTAGPAGTAR